VIRPGTIAILALCGLTGAAAAQAPAPRGITPPAGWRLQRPPDKLRPEVTSIEVFYPPPGVEPPLVPFGPHRAALYVTRVERAATPERSGAIAVEELDELAAALRRQGPGAKTLASAQRVNPAARQLEGALSWVDASVDLADSSRVVVAADPQRVVAITGQCLIRTDAPAELARACEAALATLDPGVPPAARVPLAIAEREQPAPAPADPPPPAAGPAPEQPAPAQLRDASRIEMPQPPPQPPQRSSDRRPIYVGLGLVVLALLFWWNRSRRERFEAEDERDDDGDDLHAAADEAAPAAEPPPAEGSDRKEKDA
jgi:hypothetical protein